MSPTDAPRDGEPVTALVVKVYPNGALSVEGPVHDKAWCVAVLQNAVDAVRNHHRPKLPLIIPASDVTL